MNGTEPSGRCQSRKEALSAQHCGPDTRRVKRVSSRNGPHPPLAQVDGRRRGGLRGSKHSRGSSHLGQAGHSPCRGEPLSAPPPQAWLPSLVLLPSAASPSSLSHWLLTATQTFFMTKGIVTFGASRMPRDNVRDDRCQGPC